MFENLDPNCNPRKSIDDWFGHHVRAAEAAEASGRWSVAAREWKEAGRVRPSLGWVKKRMAAASESCGLDSSCLETSQADQIPTAAPSLPANPPLSRFARHFNLTIRHWDENRPAMALAEAKKAIQELGEVWENHTEFFEPTANHLGCALHNLQAITACMKRVPVTGAHGSYKRCTEFFDRRMLGVAEAELIVVLGGLKMKKTKESVLAIKEWSTDGSTRPMKSLLDELPLKNSSVTQTDMLIQGVIEDVKTVQKLKRDFASGGALLPCLMSRFADEEDDEALESCKEWWEKIREGL